MLGWEFPPHATGGLGPACQGLARGLVRRGVDLRLVLPRVHGDEAPGCGRLIGAEGIRLDPDEPPPLPPSSAASEPDADGILEVLSLPALLRPYLGREDYLRLRAEVEAEEATPTSDDDARPHRPDDDHADTFEGGYGENLEAEVRRYARRVAALARREPFDLVHAHDWMTYPAGIAASRVTGRPLVCHLHSSEYDRRGEFPDPVIRAIEERGLRTADRVVCVSRHAATAAVARFGLDAARVRVVHNALHPAPRGEPLPSRPDVEHPLVLFLGRVTAQKGPETFLDAAEIVTRAMPHARFVLCGDGDLRPVLMRDATERGLDDVVRFPGFVSETEVARLLARASVYVMPSRSEPFGLAALEALWAGVPVIVPRASGVAEVLENRLVVDADTPDDLAERILAILAYPPLATHLVGQGRAEVNRMHWDLRADTLLALYEELLP